jgi:hypothetical protein
LPFFRKLFSRAENGPKRIGASPGIRWHFLASEEMPGREGGGPGPRRNKVSRGWPRWRPPGNPSVNA